MPETIGAGPHAALGARGRSRRWLAAALLVGLALRLVFGLAYWVDKPLTLDEQEYLLLAHNLARGRGFSYAVALVGLVEGRHVGRAPLYPLLLAGVGLASPAARSSRTACPTRCRRRSRWRRRCSAAPSSGWSRGGPAAWPAAAPPSRRPSWRRAIRRSS